MRGDWASGGDYLVFDAQSGYTLGYVRGATRMRVAAEEAWKRWGGTARVAPADVPYDWRDRQLDVVWAPTAAVIYDGGEL